MFISVNQDSLLNHNCTDGRAGLPDIYRGQWVWNVDTMSGEQIQKFVCL